MSAMEIGDESLGQCEARHWAFGRCHLIPHGPEVNHWIESRYTPGRGSTFTDAATTTRIVICEDIHNRIAPAEQAGSDL